MQIKLQDIFHANSHYVAMTVVMAMPMAIVFAYVAIPTPFIYERISIQVAYVLIPTPFAYIAIPTPFGYVAIPT